MNIWQQANERKAQKTKAEKGALESNPEEENKKIREDGGFCQNRIRSDRYREEKALNDALREVWD